MSVVTETEKTAINEKKWKMKGDPELSFRLHSSFGNQSVALFLGGNTHQTKKNKKMRGLNHYPNYLLRWNTNQIETLEQSLEEQLKIIKKQKKIVTYLEQFATQMPKQICLSMY